MQIAMGDFQAYWCTRGQVCSTALNCASSVFQTCSLISVFNCDIFKAQYLCRRCH